MGRASEERLVDAHIPWSLVAPGKLLLDSLSTLAPHFGPPFRVVEELDNLTGRKRRCRLAARTPQRAPLRLASP